MFPQNKTSPPTWNYTNHFNKMIPNFTDLTGPASTEEVVFNQFKQNCILKNAYVLEVGGSVAATLTAEAGVQKWESFNLHSEKESTDDQYIIYREDFIKANIEARQYDFVFSCNALHHISPLSSFFEKIFHALKPMGIAYLHFGPIWSAPDGHHLDIRHKGLVYRFDGINIIPNWYHILYESQELHNLLSKNLDLVLVEEVIEYVYHSNILNRNFYEDYIHLALQTGFSFLHISTNNSIDYEYHEPKFGQPVYQSHTDMMHQVLLKIGSNRNIWTRDILMILLKPL